MSAKSIKKNDDFTKTVTTFGDRLKAAREAKGLTITSMAKKLGVSTKTVKVWENNGATPRGNSIQMLAGMLNISMVWLISGESNGTNHVAQTHSRPTGINDALGEISQLKTILSNAFSRLEKLEKRLQEIN